MATGEATRTTFPLLDDDALTARILSHVDLGTTDLADSVWREPVEHYRSTARLDDEIQLVLRRHPTPLCPSAVLAEPGSYVARRAGGVPIVAVRGRDGVVRAFRNSCRHRGTALVAGTGCAASLTCPYHGWVYGLDGGLRRVPDEHGFPGLGHGARGLVPVRAEEHAGLVFVTQDGPGPADAGLDRLPRLVGDDSVLLGSAAFTVDANWKVYLEGFLEGYHLKATHRTTFLPFGYDNLTVVETFGRHSRVTFPFRRIEELRTRPPSERRLEGRVTSVHQIFPNTVIARLSHHTTMVVLEPVAPDRTDVVTYQLATGVGAGGVEDARRDTDFVATGAVEDLAMAVAVQEGLASGANDVVELGLFEGALSHFHRELDACLAGETA